MPAGSVSPKAAGCWEQTVEQKSLCDFFVLRVTCVTLRTAFGTGCGAARAFDSGQWRLFNVVVT